MSLKLLLQSILSILSTYVLTIIASLDIIESPQSVVSTLTSFALLHLDLNMSSEKNTWIGDVVSMRYMTPPCSRNNRKYYIIYLSDMNFHMEFAEFASNLPCQITTNTDLSWFLFPAFPVFFCRRFQRT